MFLFVLLQVLTTTASGPTAAPHVAAAVGEGLTKTGPICNQSHVMCSRASQVSMSEFRGVSSLSVYPFVLGRP